jgi:4'-phosphopantetheinyl transferase
MTDSSQVNRRLSNLDLMERIRTDCGIIFLFRLHNYHEYLSKLEKSDVQRAAVLSILEDKLENHFELTHNSKGAPILQNSLYHEISISHSKGLFAIYLSAKKKVGVDVELIRSINKRSLNYFLNIVERKRLWSEKELLIIWCAKEAYFKLKKGEVDDLTNEVTVTKISDNDITIETSGNVLKLKILRGDSFVLVYS